MINNFKKISVPIRKTPIPAFPHGEAGAFKNSPVGYFSEQAGLPRWLPTAWLLAKMIYQIIFLRSAPPLGEIRKGVISKHLLFKISLFL